MLYDDCAVGDEWPKLVRPQPGVALEVVQEGLLICIVVRVVLFHPQ